MAENKGKSSKKTTSTNNNNNQTPTNTPAKKLAYRDLYREEFPPYKLRVRFIDAATGQVITNLSGYTLVDQGSNDSIGGTPTPTTPPSTGNNRGGSESKSDPFNWNEWHNKPSVSKGTGDIIGDAQKMISNVGQTLTDWRDAGKKAIRDAVVQATGNTDLFGDELNPTVMNSNEGEGTAYNVPPAGYEKPPVEEHSPGMTEMQIEMGDKTPVARNVTMANADAVRDLPVKNTVMTDLAAVIYAVDPRLEVRINSGGQVPINSEGAVSGYKKSDTPDANRIPGKTVNHDIDPNGASFAFDGLFYLDGQRVTPASNPEIFKEIGKYATVAGFTQFGMEGNVVHLGKDPRDPQIRTWGYPGGLPSSIASGIQEGLVLKKENPELYTQMVQQVAMNDPLAPIPQQQGTQTATAAPVVDRINKVNELLGIPPIVSGINAASETIASGLGGFINSGAAVADFMNTPTGNPMFPTYGDAAIDAGKPGILGITPLSRGKMSEEIGKSLPGVATSIAGGIQSGMQSLSDLGKGIGQQVAGFMKNPVLPSMPTGIVNDAQIADAIPVDEQALDILTRTIVGEAAGEDMAGKVAVANVLKNRTIDGTWGDDPAAVATFPKQFSAWNAVGQGGNNLVRSVQPGDPLYEEAKQIAMQVFNGQIADNTGGSLYYHTPGVQPDWANQVKTDKGIYQLGNHVFYPQEDVKPFGTNVKTSTVSPSGVMTKPEQTVTAPTGGQITAGQRSSISDVPASSYQAPKSGSLASTNAPESLSNPVIKTPSGSSSKSTADQSSGTGVGGTPSKSVVTGSSGVGGGTIKSSSGVMAKPTTVPTTTKSSTPSPILKTGSSAVGGATKTTVASKPTSNNITKVTLGGKPVGTA